MGEHTNVRLISDGDEVAPGVTAVVTPGHSAGHTSYVVTTSRGNRLVAFGDCFHTPAQLRTQIGLQLLMSIRLPWAARVGASCPN
jgi:glyoxylase-like metal-dependent hydrolase (beta-lactamase superfamily II)